MTQAFPTREFYRYMGSSFILIMCSYATMLIDAAVGGYFIGPDAVSAINLVMPVNELFYAVALFFVGGASLVAAERYGCGDTVSFRRHFSVALTSVVVCLFLVAVCLFALRHIIAGWLSAGSLLSPLVMTYLSTMIPWFVADGILLVFKEFTIISGRPAMVMLCAFVQLVTNVACNIFFLGVLHSGIGALALSSLISALVMLVLLLLNYLNPDCPFRMVTFTTWSEYLRYLRVHLRFGSGLLSMDCSFIIFGFAMNGMVLRLMGKEAMFVWSVIIMAFYAVYYASGAGQQTCIALGGRYRGMGQMDIESGIRRRTLVCVAVWTGVVITATFFFPNLIMPLFGASDNTLYGGLLPVIGLAIPFIVGNNLLTLSLLELLQNGRVFRYSILGTVLFLNLPVLLWLFHLLLPGHEWYCFAAMLPVQLSIYFSMILSHDNFTKHT